MKTITLSILAALGGITVGLPVVAQQASVDITSNQAVNSNQIQVSDAQLDSLLAPIALYPDTLLTHILIASTYPFDVISADRWRQSNKHLTPEQVESVLEDVNWDPSVKALAAFSDLLNTMASDLTWLQQLGDSVLISQDRVLDRVQILRQHARNTGNLGTNDYVEVETEQNNTREIIYITPRQREVVYVPYYDPQIVYGSWWHPIAPIFWSHHVSYHRHRNIYWSPRISISAFFSFGAIHWSNRHVIVHRQPVRRFYRGSQRKRVISNDYQRWEHRVDHRRARYSQRVVQTKPTRFTRYGNKNLSTRRVAGSPSSRSTSKMKTTSNAQLKAPTQHRGLSNNRRVSASNANQKLKDKKQYNKQAILSKLDANKRHYAKTSTNAQQRHVKNNRHVKPQPIKPQPIKLRTALSSHNAGVNKTGNNKVAIDKGRTYRTDSNRGKASQNRASSIVKATQPASVQIKHQTKKQTINRSVSPGRSVARNERRRSIQSQNRLSRDK